MSEQNTNKGPLEDLTSSLISVTEAAKLYGCTPSYIRRLLREGRIEGVKIGRNWLTTEKAIQELKQKR